MEADRAQIRATLLDSDLSETWLRAKVQQLLDSCDELVSERDALREALEAIARLGVAFDAKGTRSRRVNEIARGALEYRP